MTDNETPPQCRAKLHLSWSSAHFRCVRSENHDGPHKDEDQNVWTVTGLDEPLAVPVDIRVRPVQDQLTALTVRVGLLEADRACAPVYLAEPGMEQGDYLHGRTHWDLIKELYQRVSESERKFVALREDNTRLHARLTGLENDRDALTTCVENLEQTSSSGGAAGVGRCEWISPTRIRCALTQGHTVNHLTPARS